MANKQTKIKVHFMAPVTGKRPVFERICALIQSNGYELLTEHILNRTLEQVNNETDEESKTMTRKLHNWIREAQIVVYEVSTPNVSVGYEIALAFTDSIPVILLYHEKTGEIPHGLKGIDNDLLQMVPYDDESLPDLLKLALKNASSMAPRRTYVIFPALLNQYLTWVEHTYKVPSSMYLRVLVEADMRDNRAYQAHLGNEEA